MATNQFLNVPLSMPDTAQHIRLISSVINNTVDGKLNATGDVTLTASSTSTTLTDARIGANSIILFMPTTANGNSAKANLYVSARGDGTATLTHSSDSATDQTFGYIVIG